MAEQNERSAETFANDGSGSRRHRVEIRQMMDKQSIRRRLFDKIATGVAMACVIAAIIPLGSILVEVVKNGVGALSLEFLTQPPGAIGSGRGGIGPAIQGTPPLEYWPAYICQNLQEAASFPMLLDS
jgi:hypothetical protein